MLLLDQIKNLTKLSTAGPLKILMVSVEATPFSNVGGVARVVTYLSTALKGLGHDVRVIVPKFDAISEDDHHLEMVKENLMVPTGDDKPSHLVCNIKRGSVSGNIPVYFVENMQFYEKRNRLYGYSDDAVRWSLLCRAVLEFIRLTDWTPDIIHCHDWHAGAIPDLLRREHSEKGSKFANTATLVTIHNIFYQGWYLNDEQDELARDDGRSPSASLFSERIKQQNFMRRGIMYADAVNAVSETYAREILTPKRGEGLDKLLLEVRSKLFGVLNGMDYTEFDPETDRFIASNYSIDTIQKRGLNKAALQKEFGLVQNPDVPLLGYVGRLDWQKGVDLITEMLPNLLCDFDVQFVSVGGGNPEYADSLKELKEAFPGKVGIHPLPNFTLPRLVFSGADIMLFPSRFEPCGIVQMEAMRYGAIPVVRATGGLADSVENYDPVKNTGTGFVFNKFDTWSFYGQVIRSIETYRRGDIWSDLVIRAMRKDFSWKKSADKYVKLYRNAILFRSQSLLPNGALSPEATLGM